MGTHMNEAGTGVVGAGRWHFRDQPAGGIRLREPRIELPEAVGYGPTIGGIFGVKGIAITHIPHQGVECVFGARIRQFRH